MPPETLQVVALGLIQGATELLPVSSSAHIAAVPQLLRWSVADWTPERRKELEVALHAGALLALAPSLLRALPDPRTLALSLAPPVVAGLPAGEADRGAARRAGRARERADARGARARRRRPRRLRGGRSSLLTPRERNRTTRHVGLALGGAQAAALWPGVSRTGATLAAARALGYSRAEASRLSFGVAGPVLAGATALKAWRGRRDADLRLVGTGARGGVRGHGRRVEARGPRAARGRCGRSPRNAWCSRAPSSACATVERGEHRRLRTVRRGPARRRPRGRGARRRPEDDRHRQAEPLRARVRPLRRRARGRAEPRHRRRHRRRRLQADPGRADRPLRHRRDRLRRDERQ